MRSTLTAACSHSLGHCGREPGQHELCEQFGCEAVRYHERLLADAARGAGEHFEGTALFPTETTHWSAVWYVRDAGRGRACGKYPVHRGFRPGRTLTDDAAGFLPGVPLGCVNLTLIK